MIYFALGSILLLVCVVLWAIGETLIEMHRFRQKAAPAKPRLSPLKVPQAKGSNQDPSDPVVVFMPLRRTLG
jgi:hypothetical protein